MERRKSTRLMADINVTPFVDVMLVLLIIFMVTAPLLAVGIQVDLPETKARPLTNSEEPLTITVNKDGQIFLQETEVSAEALLPKVKEIARAGFDERIYIRGDGTADWEHLAKVLGDLNRAGYNRLGLVTNPEKK